MAKKENFKDAIEDKDVELKVKAERVSDEHLKKMQQTVNAVNQIQFNIGKMEAQKHTLLHNLSVTQDRITLLQDTLMKEYGSVDIDLESGKINWPDENAETKNEK